MCKTPTAIERRIVACLEEYRSMSFTGLRQATDVSSDQKLARALKRMRNRGVIIRHVLASTPPTTRYMLPSDDGGVVKS
jgi:DNA-binding HxlR family transcriptional regulator